MSRVPYPAPGPTGRGEKGRVAARPAERSAGQDHLTPAERSVEPEGGLQPPGSCGASPRGYLGTKEAAGASRRERWAVASAASRRREIVIFGLTLSSSWGNGHATTYRALIRGLAEEGCRVTFFERDVPWYAPHRDLAEPDFCELVLYEDLEAILRREAGRIARADAVIVGSYVPEGVRLIDRLAAVRPQQLAFYDIDTPVTLEALDRGGAEYLAPRQVGLFDMYFSFSGGEILRDLERRRGARLARALYCAVDPARYRHDPGAAKRWDLGYLGTYSEDRQPALEALLLEPARRLPEMRFAVAGPQYPEAIDWPANVERIEHLPPDEHPAFYNAQRFTLNVTRAAMRRMGWSPSVRLFEAAACGTPIISDAWRGLGEIFPEGEAILVADGPDAVVAALTGLDDQRRRAIGRAGEAIVRAEHTGRARARELLEALDEKQPEVRAAGL